MRTFGTATTDLSAIVDSVDGTRADLAELRHQFDLLRARVDDMPTRADLNHAMLIQTRWILGGFALVLTAILFKG